MKVRLNEVPVGEGSGWRMAQNAAEAFVMTRPYPRLYAFRTCDGASPFRTDASDPFRGVRTWYLEPTQLPEAPLPALQPATARPAEDGALLLAAEPEPKTGLQVLMEFRLDPARPVLKVRHGLVNHARSARRIAAWAICALPHQGVGFTPWATRPETIRSLLLFPGRSPKDPSLRMGARAVGVDFRVLPADGYLKIGTNTDAGWVAYGWNGGILRSAVPHRDGGEYPEGGGTVTIYSSGRTTDDGFCEIENVGPLSDVPPGGTLWLDQTLSLHPERIPDGDDPDAWFGLLPGKFDIQR